MSCGEESIEDGHIQQSGRDKSVHVGQLENHAVRKNGEIPVAEFKIDEKLLIDPNLLFVGSMIGEGAHGQVFEGK